MRDRLSLSPKAWARPNPFPILPSKPLVKPRLLTFCRPRCQSAIAFDSVLVSANIANRNLPVLDSGPLAEPFSTQTFVRLGRLTGGSRRQNGGVRRLALGGTRLFGLAAGRAGRTARAARANLVSRCTARICPAGHSGDEHWRLRVAGEFRLQPKQSGPAEQTE